MADIARAVLRLPVTAAGAPTLDAAAMTAATGALATAHHDGARAVLISNPGPNFCLGGDVRPFAAAEPGDGTVAALAEQFHDFVRALRATPLPVVAAVQGWAAGAGMSVVLHADIAVAGRGTRLRAAYPGLGFTPDGGMTWTLPRAVGRARALDILVTNRPVGADEALSAGLVARVVEDDQVQAEAQRIAETLAGGSAAATAGIKRLVDDGYFRSLSDQLDHERDSIGARADSPDGREGVRAFAERRAPAFGEIP